jgi:hypothetical protein
METKLTKAEQKKLAKTFPGGSFKPKGVKGLAGVAKPKK